MQLIKISVVLMLLLLSSACENSIPPHLRIGTNTWPGYEPLYLAKSLGYMEHSRVHLVEHTSASHVIRSFNNKSLEAAALTLDEALLLKQYGHDVCIVMAMDISNGSDALLVRPEMQSMDALRGLRVGVESTALGAYMLSRALELSGMGLDDIHIIRKDIHEHIDAYNNGEIDAVVTFDPVRSRLLKQGASQVFDSSRLPNEIVDVLVVDKSYLDAYPEVVTGLTSIWFETLDYIESNTDAAYQQMTSRLKLSPEEIAASYRGLVLADLEKNVEMLNPVDAEPMLLNVANRLQDVMLENKLLDKPVNIASMFNCSPMLVSTVMHDYEYR